MPHQTLDGQLFLDFAGLLDIVARFKNVENNIGVLVAFRGGDKVDSMPGIVTMEQGKPVISFMK